MQAATQLRQTDADFRTLEPTPPGPTGGGRTALRQVWEDLRSGRRTIIASFTTQREYGLLVTPPASGANQLPRNPRCFAILEQSLLVGAQKVVASDSGLGVSSIATKAKTCLLELGLSCRPSRAPLFLVAAAAAAARCDISAHADVREDLHEGRWLQRLSLPRPELSLATTLSQAQFDVAAQLIEGRTYAEIASSRGTSTRTIANQAASVFRRLEVSGRNELLHHVLSLQGPAPAALTGDAS